MLFARWSRVRRPPSGRRAALRGLRLGRFTICLFLGYLLQLLQKSKFFWCRKQLNFRDLIFFKELPIHF